MKEIYTKRRKRGIQWKEVLAFKMHLCGNKAEREGLDSKTGNYK